MFYPPTSVDSVASIQLPAFYPAGVEEGDLSTRPPKPLIISVHGLKGPEQTNRAVWAWDWLPPDPINEFLPFEYSPENIVGVGAASDALEKEARNLLDTITSTEWSAKSALAPISLGTKGRTPLTEGVNSGSLFTFRALGLGGSIVKLALVIAAQDERYQHILDQTQAVIFFGTPHRGSAAQSLDSIILSIMEDCYRGLHNDTLPEKVNALARELETIQQQFDMISGQFRIISYYQNELPSSVGKTIITKDCATLGQDNETLIGCNRAFQDIGRVMSREESSLLQMHLINVGIERWSMFTRCENLLRSSTPGSANIGWLCSHPWSPGIVDRYAKNEKLSSWLASDASKNRFLRITTDSNSQPVKLLNSIARAIWKSDIVPWYRLPPAWNNFDDVDETKPARKPLTKTDICLRILWQIISQQPHAFLHMAHLVPHLTDALKGSVESWKQRVVWQCLRTVLVAPVGVTLYGLLHINSLATLDVLERMISTVAPSEAKLKILCVFEGDLAQSWFAKNHITYQDLHIELESQSQRRPREGPLEIRADLVLQLLPLQLRALGDETGRLTFATLVWIGFAIWPPTVEELDLALAFHESTLLGFDPVPRYTPNTRGFAARLAELLPTIVIFSHGRLFPRIHYAALQRCLLGMVDEYLTPPRSSVISCPACPVLSPHLYIAHVCLSILIGRVLKDDSRPVSPANLKDPHAMALSRDQKVLAYYSAREWITHYKLAGVEKTHQLATDLFFEAFVADETKVQKWLSFIHATSTSLSSATPGLQVIDISNPVIRSHLNISKLNDLETLARLARRPSRLSGPSRLLIHAAETSNESLLTSLLPIWDPDNMTPSEEDAVIRALACTAGPLHDKVLQLGQRHLAEDTLIRAHLTAQALGNKTIAAELQAQLLSVTAGDVRDKWLHDALQIAMEYGDDDTTNELLNQVDCGSSEAIYPTPEECTTVHRACSTGNIALMRKLWPGDHNRELIRRKVNIQMNDRSDGRTPLFLASAHGFSTIVEYLLDNGADPKLAGWALKTPLHIASYYGNLETVKVLVNGCGTAILEALTVGDANKDTPLHLAIQQGHEEVAEYLASCFPKIATPDTPTPSPTPRGAGTRSILVSPSINSVNLDRATVLFAAVEKGLPTVVRRLLERGAHPNILENRYMITLHMAARGGAADTINELLKRGAKTDMFEAEDRLIPIHYAIYRGHTAAVEALAGRCNLSLQDKWGRTPLAAACAEGYLPIVEILFPLSFPSKEDEVNKNRITQKRNNMKTTVPLLIAAAENGHRHIVRYLLKQGCPINGADPKGVTALMSASFAGQARMVQRLILQGASVTLRDDSGAQALHGAVMMKRVETAQILVESGPGDTTLDVETTEGRSPLSLAIYMGSAEIVSLLLDAGARMEPPPSGVSRAGYTTLLDFACAVTMDAAVVEMLVRFYSQGRHHRGNKQDGLTATEALIVAIKSSRLDVLQTVLRIWLPNGKQVSADAGMGKALCCAAALGDKEALLALLQHPLGKASVNEADDGSGAALHTAICTRPSPEGNEIVTMLMEHGADPCRVAGIHGTTLNAACAQGKFSIAEKLLALLPKEVIAMVTGQYGTPIQAAIMGRQPVKDTLALLDQLKAAGCSARALGGELYTAFHAAAFVSTSTELIDWFMEEDSFLPLIDDPMGRIPLHLAIAQGSWSEVEAVLDATTRAMMSGTLETQSPGTQTPSRALEVAWFWTAKDFQGRSGLHYAAVSKSPEPMEKILEYLVESVGDDAKIFVNEADDDGWTPLHWACLQPSREIVASLIAHQADPGFVDKDGRTPRQIAMLEGYDTYLELLAGEEVDVGSRTSQPETDNPRKGTDSSRKGPERICKACFLKIRWHYYRCMTCSEACDADDFELCFKCGQHADVLHDRDHVFKRIAMDSAVGT